MSVDEWDNRPSEQVRLEILIACIQAFVEMDAEDEYTVDKVKRLLQLYQQSGERENSGGSCWAMLQMLHPTLRVGVIEHRLTDEAQRLAKSAFEELF